MSTVQPNKTLPVRVLGLGSENGVDQLGWLAARQLETSGFAQRYPVHAVDIAICRSPALLAAHYTPARALILIDAWRSEEPAGSVKHLPPGDIASNQRPASSHGLDLKQALALCSALETGELPVAVIGISTGPGVDTDDTQKPLDILATCFPALQEAIEKSIRELIQLDATCALDY